MVGKEGATIGSHMLRCEPCRAHEPLSSCIEIPHRFQVYAIDSGTVSRVVSTKEVSGNMMAKHTHIKVRSVPSNPTCSGGGRSGPGTQGTHIVVELSSETRIPDVRYGDKNTPPEPHGSGFRACRKEEQPHSAHLFS